MQCPHFDVVVIGSGFAGSLTALLLAKRGHRVLLLEQSRHPRFAIGESSTPLGNFKLRQIAQKHRLDWLEPFGRYGTWKTSRPEVVCGPKRGFAYFAHRDHSSFVTDALHSNEWMVAASSNLQVADTHWLRSDMDYVLVKQAQRAGVTLWEECSILQSVDQNEWDFSIQRGDELHRVRAAFVVIATGNTRVWEHAIEVPSTGRATQTRSRTLFAHFHNVLPWASVLDGLKVSSDEHPFPCDQSALHHIFDGGWMWQLRFDNGITSAGFMLDVNRHPSDHQMSPAEEWAQWIRRFPSIAEQFFQATITAPINGIQRIDRLQHPLRHITGPNWACLPAAIGFADPLFSTGIAHGLFCVDRLVDALDDLSNPIRTAQRLADYARRTELEIDLIDRLVALAYRASSCFENYVAATKLYFIAATTCEARSRVMEDNSPTTFLLADDAEFLAMFKQLESSFDRNANRLPHTWQKHVHHTIQPFDRVGLTNSPIPRMITRSAAE